MVRFVEETANPSIGQAYRFVRETGWVPTESPSATDFPATHMQLVTWNIDAQGNEPEQRFVRAMLHLRKKVLTGIPPPPCCILLQEVHEDVLPTILRYRWIREHFLVTPTTTDEWIVPHGLVTLISKSLPVSKVFSIDLPKTTAGRRAVFVDVHLSGPRSELSGADRNPRIRTIRISNTHLEPEPLGTRVRPKQLEAIAKLLNVPNADAQICAGSMCSVRDSDALAPSRAGFADAYTGDDTDGVTWGHHIQTSTKPCRLDKILYFPTEQVEIQTPNRIGLCIALKDGEHVSDHCGVSTTITVLEET